MGDIHKVGILGSGIMGSGLAEVAAAAGFEVVVRSRTQEAADEMLASIESDLAKAVARGKSTAEISAATLGKISVTDDMNALADCDLVIESVIEDLAIKQAHFAELDQIVKPGGILATNTSTLPVVELAKSTERPHLVCGIHFFNPAQKMTLVEIVRPVTASDETIAAATKFAVACGKDTVETQDHAGFVVNALLFPYLNNAVRMLEHGTATMEDIDIAMKGGCNFPMGPFALLDLIGIDTAVAILDALHNDFGETTYKPRPMLRMMLESGQLGRKSKVGFYKY